MPLRQITLKVPDDELDQVTQAAKAKGISASEYMRRAIALQLAHDRWAGVPGEERFDGERDTA
jgi:Ribbon-helix-helix protein, copG family